MRTFQLSRNKQLAISLQAHLDEVLVLKYRNLLHGMQQSSHALPYSNAPVINGLTQSILL